MKSPKVLVLAGDGINCERDTARAFRLAGADPQVMHINDLLQSPKSVHQYEAMAFPGGFSFGDDLGSGQVLALKLSYSLGDELRSFVSGQKPMIGICNGFQAMTKLGLLPDPFAPRVMALAHNSTGNFIDRWVGLEMEKNSVCIWTKNIEGQFALPIRHGEGCVVLGPEEENIHRQMMQKGQVVLRYSEEVNGSYKRIAGVCSADGLIFGLMPHPEAAVSLLQSPQSSRLSKRDAPGIGLQFFENCVAYLREK